MYVSPYQNYQQLCKRGFFWPSRLHLIPLQTRRAKSRSIHPGTLTTRPTIPGDVLRSRQDSAQFSTLATELADQSYAGTALTRQLATVFTITVASIWLIALLQDALGWRWAFAFLAPGSAIGVMAMLRLKSHLPRWSPPAD